MAAPDVLFLVLDSVRPDRMSTYGHSRLTTPVLDRFSDRATTYEHAFTPAPWTLPSHTSMFTGLTATEHGVRTWYADQPTGLSSKLDTLPQLLADRGYVTAGFSNNPWVGSLSGLDAGFDEFVEWDLAISQSERTDIHGLRGRVTSRLHSLLGMANKQPLFLLKRRFFTEALVDRATAWLEQDHESPRFTFLNLMEAHSPYFPPRSAFSRLNLDVPGPLEPRLLNTRMLAYTLERTDLTDEQRARTLEYYDASLRYQDRKVGELLDALKATDRYDQTLIIVCSDHGKTIGEFDRSDTPPHYLRWTNTDVPLLVKAPDQHAGRTVSEPVELTGLFDLVLSGGQSPATALSCDGYALVEEFTPHTSRSAANPTRWRCLVDGEYRYIRSETGDEYLIHNGDACETSDSLRAWLSGALDDRVATLEPVTDATDHGGSPLGAGVERQLSDLGYLE